MTELHCPGCGGPVRATVGIGDGAAPSPAPRNGWAVCAGCAHVGVLSATAFGTTIRSATLAELSAWAADPRMERMRQIVQAVIAGRGP